MTIIRKARMLRYLPFLPSFLYVRAGGQEARQAVAGRGGDDGDGEWVISQGLLHTKQPACHVHALCNERDDNNNNCSSTAPLLPFTSIHTYAPDLHLMKGTERNGTEWHREHDCCSWLSSLRSLEGAAWVWWHPQRPRQKRLGLRLTGFKNCGDLCAQLSFCLTCLRRASHALHRCCCCLLINWVQTSSCCVTITTVEDSNRHTIVGGPPDLVSVGVLWKCCLWRTLLFLVLYRLSREGCCVRMNLEFFHTILDVEGSSPASSRLLVMYFVMSFFYVESSSLWRYG